MWVPQIECCIPFGKNNELSGVINNPTLPRRFNGDVYEDTFTSTNRPTTRFSLNTVGREREKKKKEKVLIFFSFQSVCCWMWVLYSLLVSTSSIVAKAKSKHPPRFLSFYIPNLSFFFFLFFFKLIYLQYDLFVYIYTKIWIWILGLMDTFNSTVCVDITNQYNLSCFTFLHGYISFSFLEKLKLPLYIYSID